MAVNAETWEAAQKAYTLGQIAGLEEFRKELLLSRGLIENETETAFDVIVELLDRVLAQLRDK